VESLGLPSTRIRRGLFELLETLDIKKFDVMMFARNNLSRAYEHLALARSLEDLPQSGIRDLAMDHLKEKKERILENILKVLAIHDQSKRMKSAWQGIFSSDTRQRANAVELLQNLKKSGNPHILSEVDSIVEKKQSQPISLGEKILLLKEIEVFSELSASELAAIAGVTEEMTCGENEDVIRQNRVGETFFLIVEGQVSVIMEGENGNRDRVDQMTSGSAFGEMALIDNFPRSTNIRTMTACRFLILHKQEFKKTAMEFPRISLQLCSVLSQRIRHLHSLVQEKAR
jgi:hypothetical protein